MNPVASTRPTAMRMLGLIVGMSWESSAEYQRLTDRAEDRALVHRVGYDELCRGIVRAQSRAAYRAVINRLVADGAQGVVLGCAGIELLVGADDSPVPVFPTTRLHMEAGVAAALAG